MNITKQRYTLLPNIPQPIIGQGNEVLIRPKSNFIINSVYQHDNLFVSFTDENGNPPSLTEINTLGSPPPWRIKNKSGKNFLQCCVTLAGNSFSDPPQDNQSAEIEVIYLDGFDFFEEWLGLSAPFVPSNTNSSVQVIHDLFTVSALAGTVYYDYGNGSVSSTVPTNISQLNAYLNSSIYGKIELFLNVIQNTGGSVSVGLTPFLNNNGVLTPAANVLLYSAVPAAGIPSPAPIQQGIGYDIVIPYFTANAGTVELQTSLRGSV